MCMPAACFMIGTGVICVLTSPYLHPLRSDILDENPDEIIGDPVSILESMHNKAKDGDHYFNVDEDDWEDDLGQEEPLTWSLTEPSSFCDWTIEVTRIHNSPSPTSRCAAGRDKKTHGTICRDQKGKDKSRVQRYHVHKAILSVG